MRQEPLGEVWRLVPRGADRDPPGRPDSPLLQGPGPLGQGWRQLGAGQVEPLRQVCRPAVDQRRLQVGPRRLLVGDYPLPQECFRHLAEGGDSQRGDSTLQRLGHPDRYLPFGLNSVDHIAVRKWPQGCVCM